MRLLFLFAIFINCSLSQIAPQVWQGKFGNANYNEIEVAEGSLDRGIIASGFTYSSAQSDAWVVKLNQYGSVQWSKVLIATLGDDTLRSVKPTSDGGFIACGQFVSTSIGGFENEDAWVVKFNPYGGVQWSKLYGGFVTSSGRGSSDRCYGIVQVADGFIFAGWEASFQSKVNDEHSCAWVVKLDSTGTLVWAKSYPAMAGAEPDTMGDFLLATNDGNFLITAINWNYSTGDWSHGNAFFFKIDSSGNQLWRNWWDGGLEDRLWGVVDDGTNYWTAGFTTDVGGSQDITLMKYDISGSLISSNSYGTTLTTEALGGLSTIALLPSGNILIGGFQTVAAADTGLLFEIDKTTGNITSQYSFGNSLTQLDSIRVVGSSFLMSGHTGNDGMITWVTNLTTTACTIITTHSKRTGRTVNAPGTTETLNLSNVITANGPTNFTPGPVELPLLACGV